MGECLLGNKKVRIRPTRSTKHVGKHAGGRTQERDYIQAVLNLDDFRVSTWRCFRGSTMVLVTQYRGISFRWDPVGMRHSASNEYSELERCNAKKTKSHVVTSLRVVKTGEAFEKMLFFF